MYYVTTATLGVNTVTYTLGTGNVNTYVTHPTTVNDAIPSVGTLSTTPTFTSGTTYSNGAPVLNATYTDADSGDNGQVKFDLCSNSTCGTVVQTATNTALAPTGTAATITSTTTLTDATQYWWQAVATDGKGIASTPAIQTFTVDH